MQARDIMTTDVVRVGPDDVSGVEDRTIGHPAVPVSLL